MVGGLEAEIAEMVRATEAYYWPRAAAAPNGDAYYRLLAEMDGVIRQRIHVMRENEARRLWAFAADLAIAFPPVW
jgi:hypothetical protein